MKNEYKHLFEPIKVGKVELKNRIVMLAIGTGLSSPEGRLTDRLVEYYVERAKGGVGLIVSSVMKVENEIEADPQWPANCITTDPIAFISIAGELTERVHAYGTKFFVQLTAGMGRNHWASLSGRQPVAPSPVPSYFRPDMLCRELTADEIEKFIKKFGESAAIAAQAGFDGIEVHGHSGYLIDSFLWASLNKRTDKYGGDLRGRLTFPIEIMREIKRTVGKDFPVMFRFSLKSYMKQFNQTALPGEEFQELGLDIEDMVEAGKIFEEAGYDGFDCDAGCYDGFYWAHPPTYQEHGIHLPLTEKLKREVRVPVVVSGRMEVPDLAERALAEGKADAIGLARQLLADPFWPNKVLNGEIEKIRPCVGCHVACTGRAERFRPVSCSVNPACGREKEYGIERAQDVKRIMVIGGGVAGMEAARVAALRGHEVTINEKSNRLGGHLIVASVPDFKEDYLRLLNWYKNELAELNIKTNLGKEVSPESIKAEKPDAVIVATGSKPATMDIPGMDKGNVTTAIDLLLGNKKAGQSVAVIGGALVACETALWLAKQGKKVTIVARGEVMGPDHPVPFQNKLMLMDLLVSNKVELLSHTTPTEIIDSGIVLKSESGSESTLTADTVALAVGMQSDQELYRSLAGKFPNVYLIGDAREDGDVMLAIWDAYEVARSL